MRKLKFFSTDGMVTPPKTKEYFRIGPWVGTCIIKTKWFVVMLGGK